MVNMMLEILAFKIVQPMIAVIEKKIVRKLSHLYFDQCFLTE